MDSETETPVLKFASPQSFILAGASGSGKTMLLFQILKHANRLFTVAPRKIIYCYGVKQKLFDDMKTAIANIDFFEGLPTREEIELWGVDSNHKILIIDDLLQKASKSVDVVDLFCQYSHHLNFSVFFLVQNLFSSSTQFRSISLNAHAFIIFKNQRDQLQIQTLGRQIFPGQSSYFMDAYRKATTKPYGYLLIDCSPHLSQSELKLRTDILPGQLTTVFLPVNTASI